MCIAVFLWKSHPLYPLFLMLNRDEFHSRPTETLAWWPERGETEILGGRDVKAGGTWLACSKNGRLAFVTNVRGLRPNPSLKSRGDLPIRFLESKKSIFEFADEVAGEADQFNGFNLILADLRSETMLYVTNRPKIDRNFATEVTPGIHVLTNATLDTPWPKAQRLRDGFKELLENHGDREIAAEEMAEKLMTNTVKNGDTDSFTGAYSAEREYQLSSIFVDCDTPLGRYGTRSTSVVTVKPSGEVNFYEKFLDSETGQWKQQTITYEISNRHQEC